MVGKVNQHIFVHIKFFVNLPSQFEPIEGNTENTGRQVIWKKETRRKWRDV